ncbi:Uncharacterised protein [Mycobacteroides abscessus subsp. abscessus]|nr:Uncharacterised protein [Mycobacteroides abscessus subsp. abscessus]
MSTAPLKAPAMVSWQPPGFRSMAKLNSQLTPAGLRPEMISCMGGLNAVTVNSMRCDMPSIRMFCTIREFTVMCSGGASAKLSCNMNHSLQVVVSAMMV